MIDFDASADADHRPDVSIAADAAIAHHPADGFASGQCCRCGMPIVALYDGTADDELDTAWHHADVSALVARH